MFEFEKAEVVGNGNTVFWYCTLKKDIGPYIKGERVRAIVVRFEEARIEIYRNLINDDRWSSNFEMIFSKGSNEI